MLLALISSLTLLALAACCAHRLWFSTHVWQALVFLPPMLGAWAASLFLRTPTDMSALATFLSGDLALYGLAILGVMRMLGGLPMEQRDDGDGGFGSDDGGPEPADPGPTPGPARRDHPNRHPAPRGPRPERPRPARQLTKRSQPARDVPRASRARATWWSGRND
jgi:hypothetical protein